MKMLVLSVVLLLVSVACSFAGAAAMAFLSDAWYGMPAFVWTCLAGGVCFFGSVLAFKEWISEGQAYSGDYRKGPQQKED